ncbi:MAG: hypothetical protein QY323_04415 [Patescibacteria group bacterium]|nr:MAG: hypothetical protein QY323_04415 [Patescibacteria group bacterium]
MFDTNMFVYLLPALTALFCFGATIAAFNFILLNKGAKMNVTWTLAAFGTTAIGVANLFVVLRLLLALVPVIEVAGAACLFASALHARALYKKLLK